MTSYENRSISQADAKNLADSLKHQLKSMGSSSDNTKKNSSHANLTQQISTTDNQHALDTQSQLNSQASSASTFGIPTTPKTTPFLTPNPLSPISSEEGGGGASLVQAASKIEDEDQASSQKVHDESAGGANTSAPFQPRLKPKRVRTHMNQSMPGKFISANLFHAPEILALVADRMTAGARKFVVLDFGG